jgi:hypothetical protein
VRWLQFTIHVNPERQRIILVHKRHNFVDKLSADQSSNKTSDCATIQASVTVQFFDVTGEFPFQISPVL